MQNKDPDLIAKNECVGALFAGLTGRDPYLNDNVRSAIDYALSTEGGDPVSLDEFMRKAVELSMRKGHGASNFSMCHVNLRSRCYEPLWIHSELVADLKRMTGCKRALLVISGLSEAVARSLPRRRRRMGKTAAMSEARHFIDTLGARFSARGCRLSILYLD